MGKPKRKGGNTPWLLPVYCHKAVADTINESKHLLLEIAELKPGSQLQLVKVDTSAIPTIDYRLSESEIWNIILLGIL